ncbi:hypothetical protein LN384_26300, partial [Enterobacter hormaechei subsp. steigerwaltii]|nr:hypothetical protein [Enterobacter hormaechei subsp. steigerwaltii]
FHFFNHAVFAFHNEEGFAVLLDGKSAVCQAFFERAREYHVAEFGTVGIERFDKYFAVGGNGINALSVEFAIFKRTGIVAPVLAAHVPLPEGSPSFPTPPS